MLVGEKMIVTCHEANPCLIIAQTLQELTLAKLADWVPFSWPDGVGRSGWKRKLRRGPTWNWICFLGGPQELIPQFQPQQLRGISAATHARTVPSEPRGDPSLSYRAQHDGERLAQGMCGAHPDSGVLQFQQKSTSHHGRRRQTRATHPAHQVCRPRCDWVAREAQTGRASMSSLQETQGTPSPRLTTSRHAPSTSEGHS